MNQKGRMAAELRVHAPLPIPAPTLHDSQPPDAPAPEDPALSPDSMDILLISTNPNLGTHLQYTHY